MSATSFFKALAMAGLASTALAGFSSSSQSNFAAYWGQNSHGLSSGALAQQRLSHYCANTNINIIPLAFLTTISDPSLNFASASNKCTIISGTNLLSCPEIGEDIKECQSTHGKTIILSIGGATYTEGGFTSPSTAKAAARNMWALFGPPTSKVPRPFGTAVIDGFDFDFESTVTNIVPFAQEVRSLMDASSAETGNKYILTAAPQCPYPDAADGEMLAGAVKLDAIFVQFYNNYCGVQSFDPSAGNKQNNFNFETWDNWAKTVSKNPKVKVFLGVPGSSTAAGSGYLEATALNPVIEFSKQFTSFGGVMVWDISQIYANPGWLDTVSAALEAARTTTEPQTISPALPVPEPVQMSMEKAVSFFTLPAPSSTEAPSVSESIPEPAITQPASPPNTESEDKGTYGETGSKEKVDSEPTDANVPNVPSRPSVPDIPGTLDGTVNQWNQCAGEGWRGGTACKAPYVCSYYSKWYSMCK